jgi:hypothetical protein
MTLNASAGTELSIMDGVARENHQTVIGMDVIAPASNGHKFLRKQVKNNGDQL